jgi:hypothetical protein
LRRFSCYIGDLKIAQIAVGFGHRVRIFAEGLQILPEFQWLWRHVIGAFLMHLGDGDYRYGSPWSLEAPRENELASIPGVSLISSQAITVFSVDFDRWDSWDAYLAAISTNAKRNAKRATKTYTDVSINRRSSFSSMIDIYPLLVLRKNLSDRRRIHFSWSKLTLRFLLRTFAMREKSFTALARGDGVLIAAFGGIEFGPNTYYLESGSIKENNGMSWFLMLRMLRDAYDRAPHGHFVTGFNCETGDNGADAGLTFFRSQCNATTHPTSEVVFAYRRK